MRPKFATLAAAACLALNVFIVPHAPAAQPNLPALGEAESDEFSIDDERKLGEQIMRQIRPDPAVIDDPVLFEYLMSIFGPLHDAARQARQHQRRAGRKARVGALPRARHRVQRVRAARRLHGRQPGLIAQAGTRDEMASVLGHELSHITQRHIARSMVANKRQSMVTMAAMLLGLLFSAKSRNGDVPMAVITSGQAAMATGQLTFSRQMETEADTFGQDVMTDAGFSPSGMADMFGRLEEVEPPERQQPVPVAAHPPADDRAHRGGAPARPPGPAAGSRARATSPSIR